MWLLIFSDRKTRYKKHFKTWEGAYTLVQEADASSFQECEDALDKEAKQMNEVIEKINTVLMKSTHPATQRVSDPPMTMANPSTRDAPHAMPNKALKPFTLQYKSKPRFSQCGANNFELTTVAPTFSLQ